MTPRSRLYVAALVGAVVAYLFTVIAFTGRFDLVELLIFAAVFLVVTAGFDWFVEWATGLED